MPVSQQARVQVGVRLDLQDRERPSNSQAAQGVQQHQLVQEDKNHQGNNKRRKRRETSGSSQPLTMNRDSLVRTEVFFYRPSPFQVISI